MIAAYALVKLEHEKGVEVDEKKVLLLCLLHDMLEARTGDHNYVNKKYITVNETKALNDMCRPLFFGGEIKELVTEFEQKESVEAQLAADADQLALIVLVKEQHDLGNPYARKWLTVARQRLLSESGRELARSLNDSDWAAWWFSKDSNEWWVNGKTEGDLGR
ncbi:HD domain-containing protein, partial [bacterium]|nr:HD domain-containing protein [bacterium]